MNLEQKTDIKRQLHLSAQQWVWAIACFYYPCTIYSLHLSMPSADGWNPDMFLEPISTILLKKTSAPVWISRISSFIVMYRTQLTQSSVITWGIVTCCVAATTSYGGLITARVLMYVLSPEQPPWKLRMTKHAFRGALEAGYFPCIVRPCFTDTGKTAVNPSLNRSYVSYCSITNVSLHAHLVLLDILVHSG